VLRAGLAGALLSGLPSAAAWSLGRGEPLAATREIGRRVLGRPSLAAGGGAHLLLSCAFAVPAAALRLERRPWLLGALYGAALYAVNFRVVAPRLWPEVLAYDGPAQLGDHLAYGLVVALALRSGSCSWPGASSGSSPPV
jgi:hypothetical protein